MSAQEWTRDAGAPLATYTARLDRFELTVTGRADIWQWLVDVDARR